MHCAGLKCWNPLSQHPMYFRPGFWQIDPARGGGSFPIHPGAPGFSEVGARSRQREDRSHSGRRRGTGWRIGAEQLPRDCRLGGRGAENIESKLKSRGKVSSFCHPPDLYQTLPDSYRLNYWKHAAFSECFCLYRIYICSGKVRELFTNHGND